MSPRVINKNSSAAGSIRIVSLDSRINSNIDNSILNVDVSYSMDMATQLSFTVFDYGLAMMNNRYFDIGREVIYDTQTISSFTSSPLDIVRNAQIFEISSITIQPGSGITPTVSVTCLPKAIQQMKRDKKPDSIKGNGTDFVRNAAKKYGLEFFGEETTKNKKINKASGDKQADSTWDVITNLAGEAKFVVFETNGFLVFASQKWLLHKWGIESDVITVINKKTKNPEKKTRRWVPLQFPEITMNPSGGKYFQAMNYPTIRVSDNDPYTPSDGSIEIDRAQGTQLRPGMTVYVGNYPNYSGFYLVSEVSFADRTPNPVSVTFRKPEKLEKDIKQIPVGKTATQIFASNQVDNLVLTDQVINSPRNGGAAVGVGITSRILPLPSADDRNSANVYPKMVIANMSDFIPEFKNQPSTREQNTVVQTGNIDLWERPVLQDGKDTKTTYSITQVYQSSGIWYARLLASIWNDGASPTELTEAQAIAKFESDGKFLGLVTGSSKAAAIKNARDYGKLISLQQVEVLKKRFPQYGNKIWNIPNTPGSGN